MYSDAAQYNHPPDYPVTIVCGGIDGAPSNTSILGKIFAGVVAYSGISSCYVNQPRNISETSVGWTWQVNDVSISSNLLYHFIFLVSFLIIIILTK